MDDKTLAYMGERVDKARELQKEIGNVEVKVKILAEYEPCRIDFAFNTISTQSIREPHILQSIKSATINILQKRKAELQHELDEL